MNSEIFYQSVRIIFFYDSVVLVPIGILLNLIQIYVFNSKDFKKLKFGFLMKNLVILESISLVWSIIVFKYLTSIGINISSYSEFTCVTFLYIVRIIQKMPLFYQIFVSFISYLSVAYPSKCISFCNKKNLSLCLIGIIIFNLIINIPNLFRNIEIVNNTKICIASDQLDMISSIDFSLFRFLLPFILFIIINSLTLKELIKSKRNSNQIDSFRKEKRFAFILIILALFFCLFNLPLFCVVIVQIIYQYFSYSSSNQLDNINFLMDCSRALAWCYYGSGFFINILCNSKFRKNFIKIISKINFKIF
jgi:hypothetical protein